MFKLCLHEPSYVSVLANGNWERAENNSDGTFSCNDVFVELKQDGSVNVKANCTKPEMIRISWSADIPQDVKIYEDAWERGYGNLSWKSIDIDRILPWYTLLYHNGVTFGIGVKVQPNAFCYFRCTKSEIILTIDTKSGTNGVDLSKRVLHAAELVTATFTDDPHRAAKAFCRLMCSKPRLPKTPIIGGNDWYCNYGNNTFDKIAIHAQRIAECAKSISVRPYMVIDDGWQLCHQIVPPYFNGGPWNTANENFGNMRKMAEKIDEIGAIPGIWFRPLYTIEKMPDEMILKRVDGGHIMDPSHPSTLAKIKEDVFCLKSWGYKLIKHDYSSFDLLGRAQIHDNTNIEVFPTTFYAADKTTAEIVKGMYQAIRDAAGDDVCIIGCNTFSHLSAGLFEIERTGDDTSGIDWARTKKMGVNTLAFRMMQNNVFYASDADCVGITDKVDYALNRQWLDLLGKSGTPLFISIAQDSYNDRVREDITEAFWQATHQTDEAIALDWFDTLTPKKWRFSDGTETTYKW